MEALLAALILAVASGRPLADGDLPQGGTLGLASVYATLLAAGPGGNRLDDLFSQFPEDHPARKAFAPVSLAVERTRTLILTDAAAILRPFAEEGVA